MSRLDLRSLALGRRVGEASGGTTDYTQLSNKPSINDVTLTGNKTTEDLFSGSAASDSAIAAAVSDAFDAVFTGGD